MSGLRERKKALTRATLQSEGLRLIAEQGYDATSCDQIAAAAGVSPATFFRYFPTKEDVVLHDVYDPMIADLVRSRPGDEAPLRAARRALAALLGGLDPALMEEARQRTELVLSVPALRARAHEQRDSLVAHLVSAFAQRSGTTTEDLGVRLAAEVVAAALGVAVERWAADGGALAEHVDTALVAAGDVVRVAR